MLTIRPEEPKDAGAVERVNTAAIGKDQEARLVNALRQWDAYVPELSLVAELEGEVVVHALFSKVRVEGSERAQELLALGPVAVLPQWQRQRIGSALSRAGSERAASLGFAGVVLIGHASNYPRFGFQPASQFGLRLPFSVPDDVFMALPLRPGGLDATRRIGFHSEPFRWL